MNKFKNATCNACDSKGTIAPASLYKFSSVVVLIGYIIAMPSALAAILLGIGFVSAVASPEEGTGIAAGMLLIMTFGSLVSGLLGYLLIGKKKVLKCNNCGAIKGEQA